MITEERPARTALALTVLATDSITCSGVEAYFRSREGIELLPSRSEEAEVVLLLAGAVTEEVIDWMREASEQSREPDMRIVLVANEIADWQLIRAFDHGMVSFLTRATTTLAELDETVRACRSGRAELPGSYVRALIDRMRAVQRDVLAPRGLPLSPAEFSLRELDVLRLLADGHDTAEVAARLSYSERTIKSTIAGVVQRLGLRNRSHAIAYAIKAGVL
ncbi:LuxR C-terminal-related transcriptional regulator [Streptomyces sp. NPDC058955]|uniref:helix-turn-helix transcriptional regulator n=1 Tax=unclassified Streptomyces TaxID=2593676 RepID=UPI00364807CC